MCRGVVYILTTTFLVFRQDLHDEMGDMLELAGEVQETLGQAYGLPDDIDEDDLEAGSLLPLVFNVS
jgi:charged multivesicular body protein 5